MMTSDKVFSHLKIDKNNMEKSENTVVYMQLSYS